MTQTVEAIVSTESSFWHKLPAIFTYPLRKDGASILIAGAVFFTIAEFATRSAASIGFYFIFIAAFLWLLIMAYLCRYFLSVVSGSAMGEPSPPTWPALEPGSFIEESLSAFLRFISPAVLSYAAAALYYLFRSQEFDSNFVLLVVAGSLYYPMSLTAVAVFDDVSALHPVPIIRSIFRAPFRYIVTCIVFLALLCLNYFRQIHLVIRVPVLGPIIRWFVLLYLWTTAMHLLGMFYYTNRHRLQWTG